MLPRSKDRDDIETKHAALKRLRENFRPVYQHIDIKEGTCCTWASAKGVIDFFQPAGIFSKCNCDEDCQGMIAPALFKEILSKTVDYIESCSISQLRKALNGEERQAWLNLGQIIMSFAFANRERVT